MAMLMGDIFEIHAASLQAGDYAVRIFSHFPTYFRIIAFAGIISAYIFFFDEKSTTLFFPALEIHFEKESTTI